MTGHLDADRLAELRAGLLGRRSGRQAAAHLASCATCAALDAQLASVTELLAAAAVPVMPPDVTFRLDHALAEAAAERASATGTDTADRPAGSRRRSPGLVRGAHRRPRLPQVPWRTLGPVAAAAAVLAGVVFGISQLHISSSSSSAATGSAGAGHALIAGGSGQSGVINGLASGRNYQKASSSGAAAAAPAPSQPMAALDALQMVRSGIDYLPATLATQVAAQLRSVSSLHSVDATPQVVDCVKAIDSTDARPSLVEEAKYDGRQAVLVAVNRGTVYRVWVAAAGCSSAAPDLLAQIDVPDPAPGTTTP